VRWVKYHFLLKEEVDLSQTIEEGEDIILDAICSVPYLIGYILNYKGPLLNRERRVKELFKSFEDEKAAADDDAEKRQQKKKKLLKGLKTIKESNK